MMMMATDLLEDLLEAAREFRGPGGADLQQTQRPTTVTLNLCKAGHQRRDRSLPYFSHLRRWNCPIWTIGQDSSQRWPLVWQDICMDSAKILKPTAPSHRAGWLRLPLWTPHLNHVDKHIVKCQSNPQRRIRQAGFDQMLDVHKPNGAFIAWEEGPNSILPASCQRAYLKLISNLVSEPILNANRRGMELAYFEEESGARIWEYKIARNEIHNFQNLGVRGLCRLGSSCSQLDVCTRRPQVYHHLTSTKSSLPAKTRLAPTNGS
ncbi:unnamed protein product [Calypogeia fissa]